MSWIHDMLEIPEDQIDNFEAYCEFEAAQERSKAEEEERKENHE